MYTNIVVLSLVASAAASINYQAIPQIKRDALQARQTENIAACASEATSILGSLPTPPPEIVQEARQNPNTNPCDFTTPKSLTKVYSSYSSELLSWYSDNKDAISSLEKDCPAISGVGSMINVCTSGSSGSGSGPNTASAAPTSSGGAAPSGTNSANAASGTSGSTPSSTDNGAVRETGFAFAALVAAGLAVVAL